MEISAAATKAAQSSERMMHESPIVTRMNARFEALEGRIDKMEHYVYDSKPPPPPSKSSSGRVVPFKDNVTKRVEHVSGRVSETENEMASVVGQVIALTAKVDTAIAIVKDQSKAQGLARPDDSARRKLSKFVLSREGRRFMISVLTLLVTFYVAYKAKTISELKVSDVTIHAAPIEAPAPSPTTSPTGSTP
jgi:hypothetical protein